MTCSRALVDHWVLCQSFAWAILSSSHGHTEQAFYCSCHIKSLENLWASWIEVDHIANHPMFSTIFSHIHHWQTYIAWAVKFTTSMLEVFTTAKILCAKEQNFVLNFLSWFRSKKLNFLHNVHELCGVCLAGTGQVRKFGNLDVDILLHF